MVSDPENLVVDDQWDRRKDPSVQFFDRSSCTKVLCWIFFIFAPKLKRSVIRCVIFGRRRNGDEMNLRWGKS